MNLRELFLSFNREDFYSKVNLHIHSNFSDGKEDFDKLVEQAKKLNMKYIAITDHNCVLGHKQTKYKNDEILIKGVEFDCFYKMSLLHILGYGIDVENEKINALCAKNEKEQNKEDKPNNEKEDSKNSKENKERNGAGTKLKNNKDNPEPQANIQSK